MAAEPARTRSTFSTSAPIGWLAVPKDWIASLGDIIRFCGQSFGDIFNGRVFHFFGEALRQAGILILGSALVIWGMVFILGLQCGIEGAYFNRSVGAPAYAGVFSAWCDLQLVRSDQFLPILLDRHCFHPYGPAGLRFKPPALEIRGSVRVVQFQTIAGRSGRPATQHIKRADACADGNRCAGSWSRRGSR